MSVCEYCAAYPSVPCAFHRTDTPPEPTALERIRPLSTGFGRIGFWQFGVELRDAVKSWEGR